MRRFLRQGLVAIVFGVSMGESIGHVLARATGVPYGSGVTVVAAFLGTALFTLWGARVIRGEMDQ